MSGAGATPIAKDFHFSDNLSDEDCTCSVADIQDLPTRLEDAKRRVPEQKKRRLHEKCCGDNA